MRVRPSSKRSSEPGDFELVVPVKLIPFLVVTFLVSLVLTGLIATMSRKVFIGLDKESGVQKFHTSPTSRLGGLGIFLGLIVGLVTHFNFDTSNGHTFALIFLSSMPVFLGGLLEDLTHKVPALARLVLALFSASCFFFLMGFGVERTDVQVVDWLLQWPMMCYLISLLVIAGFTHSVNIIDGFNGLASGQILLMLGFLAFLSNQFGQEELFVYSSILFALTLGFFCWNWPLGKIFLGDSGSYLLGFNVVIIGLTLVHRVPQLSPFAPILIGLYPLVEALFSIYRRVVVKGVSMNQPDALHLHSLIFSRVVRKKYKLTKQNSIFINSKVTLYFLSSSFFLGIACIKYSTNEVYLILLFFFYILIYVWLFRSLVRLKTPRLLLRW